jgi:outer membrane protein
VAVPSDDLLHLARHALCHQPRWLRAQADIRQRAAELGQTQAAWWPNAQLSLSGQRATPAQSIFSEPRTDLDHTRIQTLSLNWRLLDSGQRRHEQRAAQANLDSSVWQAQAAYQALLLGVALRHTEVQAATRSVLAERAAAQAAEETARTVEARRARGVSSSADLAQAQAAWQEAKLALQAASVQRHMALMQLGLEIGAEVAGDPEPNGPLLMSRTAEHPTGAATAARLEATPGQMDIEALSGVRAAALAWQAARERVWAASRALGPTLDLSVQRSLSQSSVASTSPDRPRDTRLNLTLQIPLFDGWGAQHRAAAAQAEARRAELELEEVRLQARAELSLADFQWGQAALASTLAEALLRERQNVLASAQERLRLGAADLLDLLQAQQEVAQARRAWIRASSEAKQAHWRRLAAGEQLSLGALAAGGP